MPSKGLSCVVMAKCLLPTKVGSPPQEFSNIVQGPYGQTFLHHNFVSCRAILNLSFMANLMASLFSSNLPPRNNGQNSKRSYRVCFSTTCPKLPLWTRSLCPLSVLSRLENPLFRETAVRKQKFVRKIFMIISGGLLACS